MGQSLLGILMLVSYSCGLAASFHCSNGATNWPLCTGYSNGLNDIQTILRHNQEILDRLEMREAQLGQSITDSLSVIGRSTMQQQTDMMNNFSGQMEARMNDLMNKIKAEMRKNSAELKSQLRAIEIRQIEMTKSMSMMNLKNEKEALKQTILEGQQKTLDRIDAVSENSVFRLDQLPKLLEIQALYNETQATLRKAKSDLEVEVDTDVRKIMRQIDENIEKNTQNFGILRSDLANNREFVNEKSRDIAEQQATMFSTLHEELAATKTVIVSVQQKLSEVDTTIEKQGVAINETCDRQFGQVADTIANSTTVLEEELNQIMEQRAVIDRQIAETFPTLKELHNQTTTCCTETTTALTDIKAEVENMSKNLYTIDSNLKDMMRIANDTGISVNESGTTTEEIEASTTDDEVPLKIGEDNSHASGPLES